MDTTFAKGNISLSSVLKGQIYLVVPLLKTGLIRKMCSQQLNFSAYLFNIIWSQKVTSKQHSLLKLYATGSKPVMREGFEQMNELNTGITPMSS